MSMEVGTYAYSTDAMSWAGGVVSDEIVKSYYSYRFHVVQGQILAESDGLRHATLSLEAPEEPDPPRPPFDWQANDRKIIVAPWEGNLWQGLNNVLMVNGLEIVWIEGSFVVRPIGETIFELDEHTPVQRTITRIEARQAVEVAYRETAIETGLVYDAYRDGNKIFSIDVAQYKTERIVWEIPMKRYDVETRGMIQTGVRKMAPITLEQPVEAPANITRPYPGEYVVTGGDGLPLPPRMFRDFGGKLKVELDPDDPYCFLLKWNGPTREIPGIPGPYSLEIAEYAAFSVKGKSVVTADRTIPVQTGADPKKVSDPTPMRLDIPFVNTAEEAIRLGAKAAVDLSSTTSTISFTIALDRIDGFGLTPGSIFRWDNTQWRVVTLTIGRAGVNVTAAYHTTYEHFTAEWAGRTYAELTEEWAGHTYKDLKLEPLRTPSTPPVGPGDPDPEPEPDPDPEPSGPAKRVTYFQGGTMEPLVASSSAANVMPNPVFNGDFPIGDILVVEAGRVIWNVSSSGGIARFSYMLEKWDVDDSRAEISVDGELRSTISEAMSPAGWVSFSLPVPSGSALVEWKVLGSSCLIALGDITFDAATWNGPDWPALPAPLATPLSIDFADGDLGPVRPQGWGSVFIGQDNWGGADAPESRMLASVSPGSGAFLEFENSAGHAWIQWSFRGDFYDQSTNWGTEINGSRVQSGVGDQSFDWQLVRYPIQPGKNTIRWFVDEPSEAGGAYYFGSIKTGG